MGSARIRRVAAASRFVLALIALVALPIAFPRTTEHAWALLAYLPFAAFFQFLVVKDIGGEARTLVSGMIDALLITYIAHVVGTVTTMFAALYVYQSVVNTLVSGRRVGVACGIFGMLAFTATIGLELSGVVPYAPARPLGMPSPTPAEFAASGALVLAVLGASIAVVDSVTGLIERHEEQLRAANVRLEELSRRDALTGLFNRRHVMERLDDELARVRRGRELAVVMIDLDRFKRINDETGHERGDALLIAIARALDGAVRTTDVLGRYGGDELVVLLPDTAAQDATRVARRLVDTIRVTGKSFDPKRPVTASAGVAIARGEDDARMLLGRADEAAYDAKAAGGDRLTARAA